MTLGPLVGFALILFVAGVLIHPGAAGFLAGLAAGTFIGGGKLVILAGAVEEAPVGQWEIAALVVYIDLATALIVLGGVHHLDRVPWLGRRLADTRASSARWLAHSPRMHRAAWLALAGFIAVPLNGTGALVGTVLGRTLGLSRISIATGTAFGSVAASVTMAIVSGVWAERINELAARPNLGLIVIAIVLALTVGVSRLALGGPHGPRATQRHP
jgi:uncharacterized membrane protein